MPPEKTFSEIAKDIRSKCPSDEIFFQEVLTYVQMKIKYVDRQGTWEVWSPELTWKLKKGDCSERSLLIAEMIKSQGFKAEYVWGTLDGTLHARAQVLYKGKKIQLDSSDARQKRDFNRMGIGLHPQEHIVYAVTT